MEKYYVNNNAQLDSGDHEVHKDGCYWLSIAKDTKYLGLFTSCHEAVRQAKLIYRTADGCKHCSIDCHTS